MLQILSAPRNLIQTPGIGSVCSISQDTILSEAIRAANNPHGLDSSNFKPLVSICPIKKSESVSLALLGNITFHLNCLIVEFSLQILLVLLSECRFVAHGEFWILNKMFRSWLDWNGICAT